MYIVGNGRVITRNRKMPYIEQGAVCIKENRIEEVGTFSKLLEKYPNLPLIDAKGGVIMPGFINTHHHIYSALARGMSIPGKQPQNFLELLEGTWWRLDRELEEESIRSSACMTYLDCIKNGVTTVFDHHASFGAVLGSLSIIADEAKKLGVRTCLSYEVSDRDGIKKRDDAIEENIRFYRSLQKDPSGLIKGMIGLHASFTLSEDTLKICHEFKKEGAGFHIHVAEGKADADHCEETYGMSIVERLCKEDILGEKTIAAHCIHISESDMDILKESGTMVVHNPESNMGNAVGVPKVLTMMQKELLAGLGTDGYTSDMLESMKVANLLQKHENKNPSAAWEEIPNMLFENNKRMADRFYPHETGVLKKGAYADVICLDYHPFTPLHEGNMNSHILFGMSGKDTMTTIINGKVVMKDRVLQNMEEQFYQEESKKAAKKLWSRLGITIK